MKSAAVIACPTRYVRKAKWSSRESKAAVISGMAVSVGRDVACAKKDWDYTNSQMYSDSVASSQLGTHLDAFIRQPTCLCKCMNDIVFLGEIGSFKI